MSCRSMNDSDLLFPISFFFRYTCLYLALISEFCPCNALSLPPSRLNPKTRKTVQGSSVEENP